MEFLLTVTREQSISGAAEALHLSQPTLSRQLHDMEELGKQLFIRSNRKTTLTEEGMILCKRAEKITELMKKAQDEISLSNETIAGNIAIGQVKQMVFIILQGRQKAHNPSPLCSTLILSVVIKQQF